MEAVIVTGLSGAGKSQATICLEDLGYFCVDNMPPALIGNFISIAEQSAEGIDKAAFVVDTRGGEFFGDFKKCLKDLKNSGLDYRILFLEASDEVLIRRFNETRRSHPLSNGGESSVGIKKEREILREIREIADFVIDTSSMKAGDLGKTIVELLVNDRQDRKFTINIISFGFKNGLPLESDMVLDVRFIPNPFYIPSLRHLTGNNDKVRKNVMKHPESKAYVDAIEKLINGLLKNYMREGKYSLALSVGCTGGQHRSVTIANELAKRFDNSGNIVTLRHRELER